MHVDRNGKSVKVGDKIKRVTGGDYKQVCEGSIYKVFKLGRDDREVCVNDDGYYYDLLLFELVSTRVNHLPDWL